MLWTPVRIQLLLKRLHLFAPIALIALVSAASVPSQGGILRVFAAAAIELRVTDRSDSVARDARTNAGPRAQGITRRCPEA
jgi:hypothetical protein